MNLKEYLDKVYEEFKTGVAKEHSYRGFLKDYLETLDSRIKAINEPEKTTDLGRPDYLLKKGDAKIGYIETKDISADLDKEEKSSQMDRYLGLSNLILTNYLEFRFYRNGEKVSTFKLADVVDKKIKIDEATFEEFEQEVKNFLTSTGEPIESSKELAKLMALKARGIKSRIEDILQQSENNNSLKLQLKIFKKVLIRDLEDPKFADMYAQTIAYGLFIARLRDSTREDFSRQEARELIPKTNPFLRKFFEYISGSDLDERIDWLIDDLAEMYRYVDGEKIKGDFEESKSGKDDPFLHFYEDFLKEYDPEERKKTGIYYTPKPVVDFIVRAVDDILQKEFGLARGLADISKVKKPQGEFDKVQILDPATGTGTFLAETIKLIQAKFKGQEGMWDDFVNQNLIPRLHGFEISMAPYTMAHLKLELLLQEKMQQNTINKRLKIYLTNALEEGGDEVESLPFASWLSDEGKEANKIKTKMPIMCVIGNPPYSVSSSNKSKWIETLMKDYKKDLKEKAIIALSDDYIKFIRCGQYFVDKNGEGILAYISNNSFIDGIIHRQMRKNLLESFDKIYILDLHGSTKKKETAPDGSVDKNVFDIEQGVSINIFVKTGKKKEGELGEVFHHELYGKREEKYDFLLKNSLEKTPFVKLPNISPHYFFVPKDFSAEKKYKEGFAVNELFQIFSSGIETQRDTLVIQFSKEEVKNTIKEFTELNVEDARRKFDLGKDGRDWTIERAQRDLLEHDLNEENIVKMTYRPFDIRYTFYTGKPKGFIGYSRHKVMQHMLRENVGLCLMRKLIDTDDFRTVFVTDLMMDKNFYRFQTYLFPLYRYEKDDSHPEGENIYNENKTPNLDEKIVGKISNILKIPFVPEKQEGKEGKVGKKCFAPIDIFDYIYAVLHSPSYREKYKEFLKIDFPRVPFPDKDNFWDLVEIGAQIRDIHLLKSPVVNDKWITKFPHSGDNTVLSKRVKYTAKDGEVGKVTINEDQYFDDVPKLAWDFYIGGYQPAQKWLKDRNGRKLSHEDVTHYQKMITALVETDKLMKKADEVLKLE